MTALVALGVAQLAAAILSSPIGAPVAAVGELSIDHTPPAVKNFAIREFGSSDKTVLVWGIRGVLIIFAIIIGMLAVRRLWYGLAGLAVFGAIGVYAALIQPSAKGTDALPSIIGTAIAALALRYFSRLAGGLAARAPAASLARRKVAPHPPGTARIAALREPRAPAVHGHQPPALRRARRSTGWHSAGWHSGRWHSARPKPGRGHPSWRSTRSGSACARRPRFPRPGPRNSRARLPGLARCRPGPGRGCSRS